MYVLIVLRGNWVKTDLSVKQCSPIRWENIIIIIIIILRTRTPGGRGVKIWQNFADVFYGWPLTALHTSRECNMFRHIQTDCLSLNFFVYIN